MILSAAMLLEWLGEAEAARRIHDAVGTALLEGAITVRPDGTVMEGTIVAGHSVAQRVR